MAQVPTGIATGIGSLFSTPVVQAVAAAARFLPAAGKYYFITVGADVSLQVWDGTTWQNLTAAGVVPPGWYNADGVSLGLVNNGAGSENVTYIRTGD